ncbi:MAG: hypothetical protein FWD24_00285 [Treponema sp.]|nr:hypothetical protein [Treponema sp.]
MADKVATYAFTSKEGYEAAREKTGLYAQAVFAAYITNFIKHANRREVYTKKLLSQL